MQFCGFVTKAFSSCYNPFPPNPGSRPDKQSQPSSNISTLQTILLRYSREDTFKKISNWVSYQVILSFHQKTFVCKKILLMRIGMKMRRNLNSSKDNWQSDRLQLLHYCCLHQSQIISMEIRKWKSREIRKTLKKYGTKLQRNMKSSKNSCYPDREESAAAP